jgi:carbamoyl-phosphate synthase large subunit
MNILLTSAGRRSYLVKYFREALAGEGLVHAGNSFYSVALQVADKAVITPLIYDAQYINFLIGYCKVNKIKAILSCFDVDLPILAKAKDRFKSEGIHVVVSDHEVTQICNDKWKTYNFLKSHEINTPETFLFIKDFKDALDKKEVEFPLIIKPRWGMGSILIYEANSIKELRILFEKVKEGIFKTYLSFESDADKEHCVIIQEKIRGQEYGLDVLNDLNKNYITTLVKRKIDMRAGETDHAVTEKNHILEEIGEKLSLNLQHVANLDVDCFMLNNTPHVIDMNCRFGGLYPFSHLAGANFPKAIINWLSGKDVDKEMFEINYGVEAIKDYNIIILNENVRKV